MLPIVYVHTNFVVGNLVEMDISAICSVVGILSANALAVVRANVVAAAGLNCTE